MAVELQYFHLGLYDMAQKPAPLRFYKNFFLNDCHVLNDVEKSRLYTFLAKLQQSPYGASAEFEEKEGFYAAEFSSGRIVYWKLVKKPEISIHIDALDYIEVLEIRSFKRTFKDPRS